LPNRFGFFAVYEQLVILEIVSKRDHAAHPHAFSLGGGNLVADALAGDLTFKLREGEQNVEGQPAHRRCGIKVLRDRDEADIMGIEDLDNLCEVHEAACKPVHLIDNDCIDLPSLNV
jgi:hypothetical protein